MLKLRNLAVLALILGLAAVAVAAEPQVVIGQVLIGTSQTSVVGVNDSGDIVGWRTDQRSAASHAFVITHGSVLLVDFPGAPSSKGSGIRTEISGSFDIVGSYTSDNATYHGYDMSLSAGTTVSFTIDFPGAVSTFANAINDVGETVGSYVDTSGQSHGYLFTTLAGFTTIDPPGSTGTFNYGINTSHTIVGSFSGGNCPQDTCGFIYQAGAFTTIVFPSALDTFFLGISNSGNIVGKYVLKTAGPSHGFTYTGGIFTKFDYLNAEATTVNGVNKFGVLVGAASFNNISIPDFGFFVKSGIKR